MRRSIVFGSVDMLCKSNYFMNAGSQLAELTVDSTATKRWIVLLFLKTAWSIQALLVSCGCVARRRFSFSACFCAFECDDIAGHGLK
jgi:hypothetical protein